MELDPRGFRRLRPGAEASLVLLHEEIRHGGRSTHGTVPRELVDQLRRDPDRAAQLASSSGLSPRVVQAAARGEWDRRRIVEFEVRSASRLLGHPRDLGACVARNYRRIRGCPLMRALQDGRRVPGDLTAWLQEVRRSHMVYE